MRERKRLGKIVGTLYTIYTRRVCCTLLARRAGEKQVPPAVDGTSALAYIYTYIRVRLI